MTSAVTIRRAGPGDLRAIVALHVHVWRETYRDVAPPEAVAALDEAQRTPGWRDALEGGRDTFLAEVGGEIAGLISLAAATHPAFRGGAGIKHLYVDPRFARRGVGACLLRHALEHAASDGFARAGLAVVRENAAAVSFYEAMGGRRTGAFIDPGPLWRSDNLVYSWELDAAG